MIKLTFRSVDVKKQWCRTSMSQVTNTRTTGYYEDDDENWRTHIQSKWSAAVDEPSATHDISSRFYFDVAYPGFRTKVDDEYGRGLPAGEFMNEIAKDRWTLKQMISSHLLLYRATCTFPDAIKTFDGYKMVWECHLKHNASGHFFGFSEWKGCPSVRGSVDTRVTSIICDLAGDDILESLMDDRSVYGFLEQSYATDLPDKVFESLPTEEARGILRKHLDENKAFLADAVELQSYIVSDQCEHPYDDLVAGCIA